MTKFQEYVENNKDKGMHFIAGLLVGNIVGLFSGSVVLAMLAVCAAAIGKEVYDKLVKRSRFDPIDALFTLGGGMSVIGLMMLLN